MIEDTNQADSEQTTAADLTQSLLILMMSSIHSTGYGFSNCNLDQFSSDSSDEIFAGLREEVVSVTTAYGGLGNRDAVSQLRRVDSCLRESMRVSGFTIVSLMRKVRFIFAQGYRSSADRCRQISAPPGLKLGENVSIPQNVRVGFASQAIHHDSSLYQDPLRFNAFRFSDVSEPSNVENSQSELGLKSRNQELRVIFNERFLPCGFGRHACPGRFFASQMMSLALAYMVQKYDVENITDRKARLSVLNILMPPTSDTIRVKRRAGW